VCVPEYVYGMILVEGQETRMLRQQVHHASPRWRLAIILIKLLEIDHGYDRLLLDDPAGMQA
jgi:hypothetical protein